jgi:glutathione S-transferase
MDIKLYYTQRTRATRVRWLLEELELPYQLINIDLFNGEGHSEAYKKIHPLGCVPAIDVDGNIMIESTAICEWLADQFPEKNLAPEIGSTARMKYTQWLYFISATLEPHAWNHVLHSRILPETQRVPAIVSWSEQKFNQVLSVIDEELKGKEYLLNHHFTTIDIILTNLLSWLPKLVKPYEHSFDYMNRIMNREKYRLANQ